MYQWKSQTYLCCHNLGKLGRVFEGEFNYFIIVVIILLGLNVMVVHVGVVENLVIRIEVGDGGKRVSGSGITATWVERRG